VPQARLGQLGQREQPAIKDLLELLEQQESLVKQVRLGLPVPLDRLGLQDLRALQEPPDRLDLRDLRALQEPPDRLDLRDQQV